MILSDIDILKLIKKGKLVIEPKVSEVKGVHIDLHLSPKILKYKGPVGNLKDTNTFKVHESTIPTNGYELKPKEFILGSTIEKVSIPNGFFGFVETKGNIARAGIQAHNTDGHIDPGFNGDITLEITNNSSRSIIIYSGIPFVQLFIFKVTSKCIHSYNGKYQNQRGPTVYKKD